MTQKKVSFHGEWQFIIGATKPSHFPPPDRLEFAFAGRSNVGKSSLLNALTYRKKLARTSNTPGHTRQINFFDLPPKLRLVDLPGYGYAKVSKKDRHQWSYLIHDYLTQRSSLKRLFVLIDARHGCKDNDQEFFHYLDEMGLSYQLVFTKIDKLKKVDIEKQKQLFNEQKVYYTGLYPEALFTSSEKGLGMDALRREISLLL